MGYKSPQEKKRLELKKDHFTFSKNPHAFRKAWKRKKANANRQYRRKSGELLCQVNTGTSSQDVELIAGDVTATRLQEAITRKRLEKWGTVSLGEKITFKLEKRLETVDRRANQHRKFDAIAASAITELNSLEDEKLVDTVRRIALLLRGGDPTEWMRLYQSSDPLDRAIYFVERLNRGDAFYVNALRRKPALCHLFRSWGKKANRVLAKLNRPHEKKREQKTSAEKKMKPPAGRYER